MIIKGDYGTIFELEEYSHSEMPVLVTTDGGSLEIPTTDLAMFYIEYTEHHNQKPIEVNEKASKYVKLAVAAGIEHEKEKNIQLQSQLDKHRWIPVSERLPEEAGFYLVAKLPEEKIFVWWCQEPIKWDFKFRNVTHWKSIYLPSKP